MKPKSDCREVALQSAKGLTSQQFAPVLCFFEIWACCFCSALGWKPIVAVASCSFSGTVHHLKAISSLLFLLSICAKLPTSAALCGCSFCNKFTMVVWPLLKSIARGAATCLPRFRETLFLRVSLVWVEAALSS